jgi:hypothetical protein
VFVETDLQLAAIMGGLSVRTGHRVDLPFLMERWHRFVRSVEEGRDPAEDAYASDLAIRDLLADLITSVGSARGGEIEEAIRPDDEGFRLATQIVDHPLRSIRSDRWWWSRKPAGFGNFTQTTR